MWWIIIGLIIIGIGLGLCIYELIRVNNPLFMFVGCLFMIIGFIISVIAADYEDEQFKEPTALDVYRGKTTLQITYQDSIPVDTVVVFKNKN